MLKCIPWWCKNSIQTLLVHLRPELFPFYAWPHARLLFDAEVQPLPIFFKIAATTIIDKIIIDKLLLLRG